jgi:hypothetical protein
VKFRSLLLGHRDENTAPRIVTTLDAMRPESRQSTVLSAEPAELAALWDIFDGQEVTAEHFVPADTPPMTEVIHEGKNSAPAFRRFQKRFCRPSQGSEVVWGYNHQPFQWATGPAYFVGRPANEGEPARFVFDYTALPERVPAGWPAIVPSSVRLGRFIFAGMHDYVRRISEHVCIGRVYRDGKNEDTWFVLCRLTKPTA